MNEMLIFFLIATLCVIFAIGFSKLTMKRSVAFTNALALTIVAYIIALMAYYVAKKGLIHLTWASPYRHYKRSA